MAALEFRAAIRKGLSEELERDGSVIVFGEDVAHAGGVFKVTDGLLDAYGEDRVFDTPISEMALIGAAYGSSLAGKRPVVEIMFGDFMPLVMDGLINQAAKHWFLSNHTGTCPLVVRCAVGAGVRFGAIHSQQPGPWLHGVPGLKVVCPSTPGDARGLIKASVRDENPVIFMEHKKLYMRKDEVPEEAGDIPIIGRARVARSGSDLTLVSVMQGVHDCLAVAEDLADAGVADVEVIDLRGLRPIDSETVIGSVVKTGRLIAVEEGPHTGGWAASLLAEVAEKALEDIDDAVAINTPDEPIPFSPPLEDAFLPGPERIEAVVRERLGLGAPVEAST